MLPGSAARIDNGSISPGERRKRSGECGRGARVQREGVQKRSSRARHGELVADAVANQIVDQAGLAKTHLGLGRMDVDVDLLRRHLQKEQDDGKGRRRQNIAIGFAHGMHEQAVADEAPIDEGVDRVAVELLQLRLGGEAADPHEAGVGRLIVRVPLPRRRLRQARAFKVDLRGEGKQVIQNLFAEDLKDTLRRPFDRGRNQQRMGRGVQLKMLAGVSQRVVGDQSRDMRELGGFRFEKFASRGRVVEEIAHGERGSRGRSRIFIAQDLAAGNLDSRAGGILLGAGRHLQAGDRGDRGQSLSTKTQGGDGQKVIARAELGGGMPFKGKQRVITHHAGAVIGQADELSAASLDVDADSGRARVESIFEQLLDHRGGTVDNFSGRDLVRHLIGKDVNATHQ